MTLLFDNDGPRKAYIVPLNGKVTRSFLVYANSVEEAREIMRGDRTDCLAFDDNYAETGIGRPRREPSEDR